RCTASIMRCSTGSTIARASSGSRSRISSVEPLISAKSAVTVLRSPSRFSAAGASATRIGVSPGSLASAAADAPSAAPQSSQNFADGELSAPHFAQLLGSGQPHSLQNFLPEVLSAPHLEQRMSASQPVETVSRGPFELAVSRYRAKDRQLGCGQTVGTLVASHLTIAAFT